MNHKHNWSNSSLSNEYAHVSNYTLWTLFTSYQSIFQSHGDIDFVVCPHLPTLKGVAAGDNEINLLVNFKALQTSSYLSEIKGNITLGALDGKL